MEHQPSRPGDVGRYPTELSHLFDLENRQWLINAQTAPEMVPSNARLAEVMATIVVRPAQSATETVTFLAIDAQELENYSSLISATTATARVQWCVSTATGQGKSLTVASVGSAPATAP